MYENLKGKTLLVMDRTALAACAVKKAKDAYGLISYDTFHK